MRSSPSLRSQAAVYHHRARRLARMRAVLTAARPGGRCPPDEIHRRLRRVDELLTRVGAAYFECRQTDQRHTSVLAD